MRATAIGIHQVVYAKALYPTAVMDVEICKPGRGTELAYKSLDGQTHAFLCELFGIPPNTSKALIWTEFHLWPTHIYRDLRTLNYARNLQHSWLWKGPIHALRTAFGHYDLIRRGALLRLAETMERYGHDLDAVLGAGTDQGGDAAMGQGGDTTEHAANTSSSTRSA